MGLEARVVILVDGPATDGAVMVVGVEPGMDAALVKAVAARQSAEHCVVVVYIQTYGTGTGRNHIWHWAVHTEAVLGLRSALFRRRIVLAATVTVHETHDFSLVFVHFCCALEPPDGQVFDVVTDGDGGLKP